MAGSAETHSLNKDLLQQHGLAFDIKRPTELAFVHERTQQYKVEELLRSSTWPTSASDRAPRQHNAPSQGIGQQGTWDRGVSKLLTKARQIAGPGGSDHWPCARFVVDGLLGRTGDLSVEEKEDIAGMAAAATSEMIEMKMKRQNKARVKRLTRRGSMA